MRDRDLRARILSALALAPPVVASIVAGTPFFEFLLLIAAIVMSVEWSRMTDVGRFQHLGWSMTSVVAATFGAYWGLALPVGWTAITALIAVWPVALLAWSRRCKYPLWLAAGIPVIVLPTVALDWLRTAPEGGMPLVLWLMMVVWATDIGAYASGRAIGGPKLAPRISPNKTWAGLGGGMVWAGCVGLGFALVLGASALRLTAISVVLAVLAQAGDLAESLVKRHFHLKDSGALIPGHGGLLDRVDGLLTAAPAVLLLAWLTGDPLLP